MTGYLSLATVLLVLTIVRLGAASGDDYYANIDSSATNFALKKQLQKLIYNHTVFTYDGVWTAMASIDKHLPGYPCNPNNASYIPDIYSSYCWSPEKLSTGGECGSYSKEGDCYNREHSWPNSWFGGDTASVAYTDLFLLYPSDGYVNNKRGNLPLGVVEPSAVTYKSTNGCLIGPCLAGTAGNYTGSCFEPPLFLKGDLARTYFYISVAYMSIFTCCDEPAVTKWAIHPWEETILRQWHAVDAVDDIERARNEVIYTNWQHNRNPFIDHPEFVDQIADF